MLGINLRLLQMVWTAGQTSAMSASASALLELAVALLPWMSATGRSAISATTTANLRPAASSGSASELSGDASVTSATPGLLVLH